MEQEDQFRRFKNTYPLPLWHWRQQKLYWPYNRPTSDQIEQKYQQYLADGVSNIVVCGLMTVDFIRMKSKCHGASKEKVILRGTWYYISDEKKYLPYESDVALLLESALQSGRFHRVEVCAKPLRHVMYINNAFKQFRFTKNAKPEGRDVHRGWMGLMVNKDGVECKESTVVPVVISPSASPRNSEEVNSEVKSLISLGLRHYEADQLTRDTPALARGSYGIVYSGKVKDMKETVVIKDMYIRDQKSVAEWIREIRTMSAGGPNKYIVKVHGFSSIDTILTIVMEYMPNGDLFSVLHKKKIPLSLLVRLRMARQIACGLKFLHNNHVLHRDIKSMNILVTHKYECKLTDFGMSKLIGDQEIFNTANAGTPLWMAPEVRGGIYNFPADIYSLGLVIFELGEQRLPDWDRTHNCVVLPSTYLTQRIVSSCIQLLPDNRPNAHSVTSLLETTLLIPCIEILEKTFPELISTTKHKSISGRLNKCIEALHNKNQKEMDALLQATITQANEVFNQTTEAMSDVTPVPVFISPQYNTNQNHSRVRSKSGEKSGDRIGDRSDKTSDRLGDWGHNRSRNQMSQSDSMVRKDL